MGKSSPAISAINRPHNPAQTITASVFIYPRLVSTPLILPSSISKPVADVLANQRLAYQSPLPGRLVHLQRSVILG